MTGSFDDLVRELAEVQKAARDMAGNRRGASALSMTVEGRQKIVAMREGFAPLIPALQKATRAVVAADEMLAKTLRTTRPGFRA